MSELCGFFYCAIALLDGICFCVKLGQLVLRKIIEIVATRFRF